MKLTWFGGTTFRVYVGGKVLVVDAEGVPGGIDRTELVSGADRVFGLADDTKNPRLTVAIWRQRLASAGFPSCAKIS